MLATLTLCAIALAPQEPYTLHEDVQYSDAARQPRRNRLDLFVPAADAPPPLVMFVHGGAWTGGSKDLFSRVGATLAERGFACAVINTQLFPFAKPDVMVVDCAHALGYLHRHGEQFGYDGDRLFVMGHSSGAHLCSWLAYDDRKLALAGVPKRALRGAVLLSGVYDVRCHHMALDGVFGDDLELRRRASTWLYTDKSDCPAYVAWAQRELPGLSLCGQLMRDELVRKGVPVRSERYPGRTHRDYIFQFGTARDLVTAPVVRFLEDPRGGAVRAREQAPCAVLWIAADDRERRLGDLAASALAPAWVEVVVRAVFEPTGARATALFRDLGAERAAVGLSPLRGLAGFGGGGVAVARSTLTPTTDGLAGRLVVGAPLPDGNRGAAFDCLKEAPLLCILGDRDDASLREGAHSCTRALRRAGCDATPCELVGTTAEDALRQLDVGDDLVRPMLLTFFSGAP